MRAEIEAKRRPRGVRKKVNMNNLMFKDMLVSYRETHVFDGADVEFVDSNRRNSF